MPDHPERSLVTNHADARLAARRLAHGAVVGHGFANFYVITTRPDAETVRRVNRMKGRPPTQVGSITVPPDRIADVFDWDRLPAGLDPERVLEVMDTFYRRGPFGFRGSAAPHIPDHLTLPEAGLPTAQVIAPGYTCPSNDFLTHSLTAIRGALLYITSANRSRHLTGAEDSPAHWRADGLREEFGADPGFWLLEHEDEDATRRAYPTYLPMSTTILGFHTAPRINGRVHLVLDRHGSLHLEDVRRILDRMGFGLLIAPERSGGCCCASTRRRTHREPRGVRRRIPQPTEVGRRDQVGLIEPSSNVTKVTELPELFGRRENVRPERFTFHSARMRLTRSLPPRSRRWAVLRSLGLPLARSSGPHPCAGALLADARPAPARPGGPVRAR